MSGSSGIRQGLALAVVFTAVLAAGAATNAWGGTAPTAEQRPGPSAVPAAAAHRTPDPWDASYSAAEFDDYAAALDGRYTGIGVRLRSTAAGAVEITGVERGSPADRHGVRAGDRLAAIDGRRTDGRPLTEVAAQLRAGRSGSRVSLAVGPDAHPRTVALHRSVLPTRDVTVHRLAAPGGGEVDSVRVAAFSRGTGRAVADAAARAARAGSRGLVLDLRGNSGGLVDEAREAAGVFLDGGPLARIDGAGGDRRELDAAPAPEHSAAPLVVLVDGATMSAAELLAGALQDRGRAVVVGSRTFGKGSIQQPEPHPDGTVEERTVAHYRTPSGRRVDGTGVRPDVALPAGAPSRTVQEQALTVLSGLGAG